LVYIGLLNPKSPTNLGSVLRAAGCFMAQSVFYSGTRYARAAAFQTDTHKASTQIPLVAVDDVLDCAAPGMSVVCVELAENAIPLNEFSHPDGALYVFGPEDGTIPQSVIDQADATVFIPTHGCLNLAASVNVVLYDRISKLGLQSDPNALIKKVRDRNNNVKVRT